MEDSFLLTCHLIFCFLMWKCALLIPFPFITSSPFLTSLDHPSSPCTTPQNLPTQKSCLCSVQSKTPRRDFLYLWLYSTFPAHNHFLVYWRNSATVSPLAPHEQNLLRMPPHQVQWVLWWLNIILSVFVPLGFLSVISSINFFFLFGLWRQGLVV
jgi:hypothetical protein